MFNNFKNKHSRRHGSYNSFQMRKFNNVREGENGPLNFTSEKIFAGGQK